MKKILNIVIVLLTAFLISWLVFVGYVLNITNTNEASYCRWYDLHNDVFTREPVGIIRDYPWILVQCYDSKGDIQNAVATATIWNMVEDQGCPVVILHIDCNACTVDQGFTATPYSTGLPCTTSTVHPTKIKPTVVTPERTPTPGLPTTVVPTDVPTTTPSIEPTQTPTVMVTTPQPTSTQTVITTPTDVCSTTTTDDCVTATPTNTPKPTMTRTPIPNTSTPQPTHTIEITPTIKFTSTPVPTNTPISSNTPEPTPTKKVCPTDTPSLPTPTESTECYQWLCHKPDTPAEQDYCCDSPGCVEAHIQHGDYLGKCSGD